MPDTFGVILISQEDTYLGQNSILLYVFFLTFEKCILFTQLPGMSIGEIHIYF